MCGFSFEKGYPVGFVTLTLSLGPVPSFYKERWEQGLSRTRAMTADFKVIRFLTQIDGLLTSSAFRPGRYGKREGRPLLLSLRVSVSEDGSIWKRAAGSSGR